MLDVDAAVVAPPVATQVEPEAAAPSCNDRSTLPLFPEPGLISVKNPRPELKRRVAAARPVSQAARLRWYPPIATVFVGSDVHWSAELVTKTVPFQNCASTPTGR